MFTNQLGETGLWKVTTLAGSVYKIDVNRKRVKRIHAGGNPLIADYEWSPYIEILSCTLGHPLVMTWNPEPQGNVLTRVSTTVASIERMD